MNTELIVEKDGIYVRKLDKEGEELSFELVCQPLKIVRYAPIEGVWSVTLQWEDPDKQSHEATFSLSDVYSGTKMFKTMASGGFCFSLQNMKFVRMHIINQLPPCSKN